MIVIDFFQKINPYEFSCIHKKTYVGEFIHFVYKNKNYIDKELKLHL